MDHDEDREAKDSPTWKVHELLVNNFIFGALKLNQFSPSLVRFEIIIQLFFFLLIFFYS